MPERIALVTGAARGIGAATAKLLASLGYDVAISYAGNRAAADSVLAAVEAAGRRGLAVQSNAGAPDDVSALFEAVDRKLGPLTALVNNVGITGGFARLDETDPAIIRRVIDVNIAGTILASREAVRRMSTRHGGAGGTIVNISSQAAIYGSPGEYVHYAASKGAVNSFTIGLAREVAGDGIRVNAVSPGLTETDIHADGGRPDRVARLGPGIPMGRAATAEEVAGAVAWLLSAAAGYITGIVLPVAGGR